MMLTSTTGNIDGTGGHQTDLLLPNDLVQFALTETLFEDSVAIAGRMIGVIGMAGVIVVVIVIVVVVVYVGPLSFHRR